MPKFDTVSVPVFNPTEEQTRTNEWIGPAHQITLQVTHGQTLLGLMISH